MNTDALIEAGLTTEQAKVYACLLENGLMPAKVISTKAAIGRSLTYKILGQLIELKLVEERTNIGKISFFYPGHPKTIKDLAERRKMSSAQAFEFVNSSFGQFVSSFNLLSGKPNVQFLEGPEGLQRIYDDILELERDYMIITSPIHKEPDNIKKMISDQIKKQVKLNIHVKAITPLTAYTRSKEEDEKELRTRKMITDGKLDVPAQIIIYGDKVAITNFKETIITVVIESKYITETFRLMFNYIWNHG